MYLRCLMIALALVLAACPRVLSRDVQVLAEGYSWLENLLPSADGIIWFTERLRGQILQVPGNASAPAQIWADGFQLLLGLANNPALPNIIYAVGKLQLNSSQSVASPAPHQNVVVEVDTRNRNTWSVVATLHNDTVGNGFVCHHSTGLLYTTSEGNFEPGTGVVYEVDPRTHTATLILQGLWAADGLWLDQERHLLYVGLLFTSEVIVWDITSRSVLRTIPKGIPGLLDDFCLDHTGDAIIGAAWTDNSIVMYNISTGASSVILAPHACTHPTSVRWGVSDGQQNRLFVTEGDGLFAHDTKSRLLMVDMQKQQW